MPEVNPTNVEIEESWKILLANEFEQPYFKVLRNFLIEEKKNHRVFPSGKNIFAAFDHTPVKMVRVVVLGQDPYHGVGQAHGLSFSVPDGVRPPPSLKNIYKELHADLGIAIPESGNLTNWAKQGVLLLNATLTVRAGQAGSHQGKGWEIFTDNAIRLLANNRENLVFILWGRFARQKKELIPAEKHLILESAHPSPFSANNGFFGCRHFSKANDYLLKHGLGEVNWNPTND